MNPIRMTRDRPRGQHLGIRLWALQPSPKRTPTPIFAAQNHFRTQSIAFDVTANDKEVFVILDRETLESALIQMTFPRRVVVNVLTHRMRPTD